MGVACSFTVCDPSGKRPTDVFETARQKFGERIRGPWQQQQVASTQQWTFRYSCDRFTNKPSVNHMRFRAWLHKQGFRLVANEADATLVDFASDEDAARYSFSEDEDKLYKFASQVHMWVELGWGMAKSFASGPKPHVIRAKKVQKQIEEW